MQGCKVTARNKEKLQAGDEFSAGLIHVASASRTAQGMHTSSLQ